MSESKSQAMGPPEWTEWGLAIKPVYGPEDIDGTPPPGRPGEYPFTRGPHADMYRGRLWTMRQYAGFGTPEETNERFKALLASGQTGLSVAFDLPTQLGMDSDDRQARNEVGVVGVAVSSLRDMERIFDGIPLSDITTSFTINATAPVIMAMYAAVAKRQNVPLSRIGGTLQNDLLKEFIARGTYVFGVDDSLRLTADLVEWCGATTPRMNTTSISSIHIQQAGANIVQEMAFTFLNAITYVQTLVDRGLDVNDFGARLSFNLAGRLHFFQEICKIRAARRIWAGIMRDRFGATNPRAQMCRVYGGLSGSPMVPQQPHNNILRMAVGAVMAALSGLQAVHITPWDEPFAIPTEDSTTLALRAQQIVAFETDIASTADPLAGSYFVERLTADIQRDVLALMAEVESRYGSMLEAIKQGFPQQCIADEAYRQFKRVESGEEKIVGVNVFAEDGDSPMAVLHTPGAEVLAAREAVLTDLRRSRDQDRVDRALAGLRDTCASERNVLPAIVEAVESYATIGEITGVMAEVFGRYQEARQYV